MNQRFLLTYISTNNNELNYNGVFELNFNLLTVKIDDKKCKYCLDCTSVCPSGALWFDKCFEHDSDKCMNCEVCMDVCPNNAIRILGGF